MNLLDNHYKDDVVYETSTTKKIVIDNNAQLYKVYKVRLDQLYYNDQNDRVATWISQDKQSDPHNMEREIYNKTIHQYITESNKNAINRTQKHISLVGQTEPGVILRDGRIIDGNRRFTCLRNIQEETNKTQYFETIILDKDFENSKKQIKMLELMLQHGMDEKVDYNPIDKLVGIYNDIIDKKLLTTAEYANSINTNERTVKQEVEKAKLMVEFLEFINAPLKFHIVRTMNLNDPLKDLYISLNKIKDEDLKQDAKINAFGQLLIDPKGDTTRYIRDFGKVINNKKYGSKYIEQQLDITEKICDILEDNDTVSIDTIMKLRENQNIKNEYLNSTEKFTVMVNSDTTRNIPIQQIEKCKEIIETIDSNIIFKMNEEQFDNFRNTLSELMELVSSLKKECEDN